MTVDKKITNSANAPCALIISHQFGKHMAEKGIKKPKYWFSWLNGPLIIKITISFVNFVTFEG